MLTREREIEVKNIDNCFLFILLVKSLLMLQRRLATGFLCYRCRCVVDLSKYVYTYALTSRQHL